MTIDIANIVAWIEAHQTTTELIQAALLLLIAWITGVFAYFRRFLRRPTLRVARAASFVYLHTEEATPSTPEVTTAAFVLNASLINRSNEKVVVDYFWLSYNCDDWKRRYRQKLLRVGFPDLPRKRSGESIKYMGVWFSHYPASDIQLESPQGKVEPSEMESGYLLFVSKTDGNWSPLIESEQVSVKLNVAVTSGACFTHKAKIRIMKDSQFLEEFVPNLKEHVLHESVANHDLSII